MHSWSIENWVTLVSALTAAFVSIWNAVQGKAITDRQDRYEARAQARHSTALGLAGGAEGVNLGDLWKYEKLLEKLASLFKGFKRAQVGETVTIPRIITDVGDQRWQFAEHEATRER